jgi:hypothetical protein
MDILLWITGILIVGFAVFLLLAVICAAIRSGQISELERREQFRKAFVDQTNEQE